VVLHRLGGQPERPRDLGRVGSVSEETQHLCFPVGEFGGGPRLLDERRPDPVGDGAGEHGAAIHHRAQTREQLLLTDALEQVPPRSGAQRGREGRLVVEHREHEHGRIGAGRWPGHTERLPAGLARHIGRVPGGTGNSSRPPRRLEEAGLG